MRQRIGPYLCHQLEMLDVQFARAPDGSTCAIVSSVVCIVSGRVIVVDPATQHHPRP